VNDQKLWICIDKTIDSVRLYVINIIIGILQPQDFGKTYLILTEYLDKVNNSTIFQLFDKSIHILWPNVIHEDVLLFVLDAALYMKKVGRYIQALYPKAMHVVYMYTCLAYTLHNVCEEVQNFQKLIV